MPPLPPPPPPELKSIASMTTEEWRAKYEPNGRVNLWVEEEFNAGSRLTVSATTRQTGVKTRAGLKIRT